MCFCHHFGRFQMAVDLSLSAIFGHFWRAVELFFLSHFGPFRTAVDFLFLAFFFSRRAVHLSFLGHWGHFGRAVYSLFSAICAHFRRPVDLLIPYIVGLFRTDVECCRFLIFDHFGRFRRVADLFLSAIFWSLFEGGRFIILPTFSLFSKGSRFTTFCRHFSDSWEGGRFFFGHFGCFWRAVGLLFSGHFLGVFGAHETYYFGPFRPSSHGGRCINFTLLSIFRRAVDVLFCAILRRFGRVVESLFSAIFGYSTSVVELLFLGHFRPFSDHGKFLFFRPFPLFAHGGIYGIFGHFGRFRREVGLLSSASLAFFGRQ